MSDSCYMNSLVETTALELVHRHNLDEIEVVLRESGVSFNLASKLVLLIPSAFAAAYYEPKGIEFPAHFQVGPPGDLRERSYSTEPGYNEAKALAQRWLLEGKISLARRVLDWSVEANLIKEAEAQGEVVERISSTHHGETW